jgi:hypothetical protein
VQEEIVLGSVGDGGAIADVDVVVVVVAGIVMGIDELIALAEEVTGADEVVELVGPWTQM